MAARKLFVLILIVFVGAGVHVGLSRKVWENRQEVRRTTQTGYVFPSQFARILALGHKGLYADYLFLNTLTFFGERQMYRENLTKEDWDYLVAGLDTVTDLDPYFLDPYVLGASLLTWDIRRFDDANRLLEKGTRHRTWDWRLPYYLGFNHFYFLKDYNKGAEYLMEASRRPQSPSFLPTLAARLSYYGDQARTGILFLMALISQTKDERLRNSLLIRKQALEGAALIEERIERFRKERGRAPGDINELLKEGYIEQLPEEPYGGKWLILPTGRVFSTSKFVAPPKKK
ncbi:MAG: hypothetical protein JXB25_05675 [Deltaproteobacteria bacterium]|nr:hypothetical protein [Deltaproteobacteria bacterium]